MNIRKLSLVIFMAGFILSGCKDSYTLVSPMDNQKWNECVSEAETYFYNGDYINALKKYMDAEAIFQSSDEGNNENIAVLYYQIGRCYTNLTDYDNALVNFKESLNLSKQMNSEATMLDNYIYILRLYKVVGDDKDIMEVVQQYGNPAEELAMKVYGNPSKELGLVYAHIGTLYQRVGNDEAAIMHLKKALSIIGDLFGAQSVEYAEVCIQIADFYQKQKNFEKQIETLNQSVVILETKNDTLNLIDAYGKLGEAYGMYRQEYEIAIVYLDKSIKLSDEHRIVNTNLVKYYFWKAGACYNIGDYDGFLRENTQAYTICEQFPIESELIISLKKLIKENFKLYYDLNYKGDKADGFETWLDGLLNG